MDNNKLHEQWPKIKTNLKKAYPQLTDQELVLEIGKEEVILHHLQDKLKKNRKEIFDFLSIMG